MARARNIKPGFFTNEDLVELDFSTRLLFIGLWTEADKAGRLEDRPKRLKMAIFPADSIDVDSMLDDLARYEFIRRYERDGIRAIQIVNWDKHQRPHHTEKESVIEPEFDAKAEPAKDACNGDVTVKEPLSNGEGTEGGASIDGEYPPDSLIPDSLIPDSKNTPSTAKAADSPAVQLKTFLARCKTESVKPIPEDDLVFVWAEDAGVPMDFLWLAWKEFVARYLEDTKKYKDWRRVFRRAVRENWLRLWFVDSATGEYRLNTTGMQAERVHREAA